VLAAAAVLPRKEMRRIRGGLVQLSCGKVDERTVDLETTVEVESESDEEAEIAFEPKVKGRILKAYKGRKCSLSPRASTRCPDRDPLHCVVIVSITLSCPQVIAIAQVTHCKG